MYLKDRTENEMSENIPITYVPARNTIFLSYALAWAEVLEADTIFIGVNAIDYSGYPDCRPEYIHRIPKDGKPCNASCGGRQNKTYYQNTANQ